MRLDSRDLGLLAAGSALVLLFAWVGWLRDESTTQPRYEGELGIAGLANAIVDGLDTGDHYFHPNYCVPGQTQIFTAHKYPIIPGGNITALMHHGISRMSKPAPQDDDWRIMPPGEAMWL